MHLKIETDDLNGKISKSYTVLKKTTLKTDFGCESYALLKKTNSNQRTMWWCKLFYEVTHFYKEKWGSLLH
jgi:hypothetical protein